MTLPPTLRGLADRIQALEERDAPADLHVVELLADAQDVGGDAFVVATGVPPEDPDAGSAHWASTARQSTPEITVDTPPQRPAVHRFSTAIDAVVRWGRGW